MVELTATAYIEIVLLFGIVFGTMLIAYEDGVPMGLYKRIRCRIGRHKFKSGYLNRTNKYFCGHCRVPRKHPSLKAIDGGKVDFQVNFKF